MRARFPHSLFIVIALLLSLAAPASAKDDVNTAYVPFQTSPDDLKLLDVGKVIEIIKSDLIRLENQKIYRLDNIRVPVHHDAYALDYMNSNVLHKRLGIFASRKTKAGRTDRFGNTIAHAVLEDGTWIQKDLVRRGLAWAYSTETNRDMATPLYKYEDMARQQTAGFWADPDYAVRTNQTIPNTYNTYQVYEGTILDVGVKDGIFFLNFDKTYKTDFTIEASAYLINSKSFALSGKRVTPDLLKGLKIRIHGWVENKNGPMIELTHPEQMELVEVLPPPSVPQ